MIIGNIATKIGDQLFPNFYFVFLHKCNKILIWGLYQRIHMNDLYSFLKYHKIRQIHFKSDSNKRDEYWWYFQ